MGMRPLNGIYAQSFNRQHQRVGHLFQGARCILEPFDRRPAACSAPFKPL